MKINCNISDEDVMTLDNESASLLEISIQDTITSDIVSCWIDRDNAIEIINHLKDQFDL